MSDAPPTRPRPKKRPLRPGLSPLGRFVRSDFFYRATAVVVRGFFGSIRLLGLKRARRVIPAIVRGIAPLTGEYRVSKKGIALAFPEKSEAERAAILKGAWDNFAKVLVEFIFFEELANAFHPMRPNDGPIVVSVDSLGHFLRLRDDQKTAVIVTAHLANWEMSNVVAHKFGMKVVTSYRGLGNPYVDEDLVGRRQRVMGHLVPTGRGASFELAAAMEKGEHLGMLVDQRLPSGLVVPFFGHPAQTNPLAARYARQFDCPVHGARAIRLPDDRLQLELTPPIEMPRDAEGKIDVEKATAKINEIVEGWVREHPEQWFWLHDRWRLD